LAFYINRLFFYSFCVNFRRVYGLCLWGLLLEAFELSPAPLAVKEVKDTVIAVLELKGAEELTDKCESLVGTIAAEQILLFGLREEERLTAQVSGIDGGLGDCLPVGEAQVDLMFEGC
jgi:hypothetical protein